MNNPIFWREAATGVFRYVPGDPTAESAPNGAPTLLLWQSANNARLQLGAQWTLAETERVALLRRISAQYPRLLPAAIDLQPAHAAEAGRR